MSVNPLNGLDLFDLGRFLLVFGFTLAIIRATKHLTEFKSPRTENRRKLLRLGLAAIVVGIMIGLGGLSSTMQNEIRAIKGIGTDIIAIGFSCIIQSVFHAQKQQRYLKYATWGSIGVGLVISVLAVIATAYEWF
ncbi:MAG: hypothetical protein A2Z77_06370 [Chloroflexi bacterium RBG_13_51_36]|nr:MAG: hypothetical protein A2Z77_06370 [Chloroflexi bacterium RBG_13_51_36]